MINSDCLFNKGHAQLGSDNTSSRDSSKLLKLAFIGGSVDSAVGKTHRIAIAMDGRFELQAGIFSRNMDQNRLTAKKYNIPEDRAYRNFEELVKFEKENIDAIVIMTPQDQHFDCVLKCIDNDIPVICEKALVPDVESAELIRKKVDEKNAFLSVTYNYTGYPMIREMRNMILNGSLGKVQQILLEMPQEGFAKLNNENRPFVPQQWRLKDNHIPTISLDLGIHLHMMGLFLTGKKAREVISISNTYGNFEEIVDNISALVKFEDDVTGHIWYGKTAMGYRNGLKVRILCSKGTCEWIQEEPERLFIADNKGNRFVVDRGSPNLEISIQDRYQRFKVGHPAGFIEAFSNYYYDIADSLENHLSGKQRINEYVFGIEESIEGLLFLDAISKSSKSRSWEKIMF